MEEIVKYKVIERIICGVCGKRIYNIKYPTCNHNRPYHITDYGTRTEIEDLSKDVK